MRGYAESLLVTANFDEQELQGAVTYWEGSIVVESVDGLQLGRGYLEMTGYAGDQRQSARR